MGQTLIKKEADKTDHLPLVSVVIPAYNPRYFEEALTSVLNQTYPRLEIIVCDDSADEKIKGMVIESSDERIRYVDNPERLGGARNYQQCFDLATGEYVKFLNDDDLLHPQCIDIMVRCLQRYPGVALVTSHRQPINEEGKAISELTATYRPVQDDSIIDGISACGYLLDNKANFIGEPTTTMFRKRDLDDVKPTIMSLDGVPAKMNGDVAMWLNLLVKGDLIYLIQTLSYFRIHPEQRQAESDVPMLGLVAWNEFREIGQRQGIWDPSRPAVLQSQPLEIRVDWPDDLLPLVQRANDLLIEDENDAAIQVLREASYLAPNDPWLIVTLGNVLLKNGDSEGARKEYIKAIALNPEYIPGYLAFGSLAMQRDDLKEAEAALLRVVALQPSDLDTTRVLGRMYLESERFRDGIKVYTFILQREPQDIESMMALGVCQVGSGDLLSSRSTFNKVLEIAPGNEIAEENMRLIDDMLREGRV
jgi:glycosyltransferase involved in cell wall biosynthesis